jgi:hypothetical protein
VIEEKKGELIKAGLEEDKIEKKVEIKEPSADIEGAP